MINVSDEIKQAYNDSTTQLDKIILNNNEYRITNVEYYDDTYEDGNIFGTAIARCLDFEIENNINLEKQEVEYQTGIKINGITQWISLGNFIIQDVEPNDTTNIAKVSAMDYMLKTNTPYQTNLKYENGTVRILDVLLEVCNNTGLELATTDFANKDFIVDSNQFSEGTLNRQVIQAVAQISGTFAKIKNDNKLYLITPIRKTLYVKEVDKMLVSELNSLPIEKLSECNNKYSLDSYKELILKRNTHPINLVCLGMNDIEGENIVLRDENSIKKDGENSLIINNNPFAYKQKKREQLITALFETVKGFSYTSFEIKGQAKPYLETGDEVAVIDKKGNVSSSFLFRFNYKSPNGLESEMSAPSIIKATVEYQNIPDALEIAKRTEYIVDKQNQKIKSLVSQVGDRTEKETSITQDIDSIVQVVATKDEVTEKMNVLKQTVDSTINKLTNSGGNNIFYYSKEYWSTLNKDEQLSIEEYSDTNVKQNSVSGLGYILNNGNAIQSQVIKNGKYTISFSYYKLIDLAEGYVLINGNRYDLDTEEIGKWKEKIVKIDIDTNTIDFEIISDTDNSFIIADLMCSKGNEKTIWSQNANETITDTVSIGKGIQVNSSSTNTHTRIDADGNRTYNNLTGEVVSEQTDKGTKTKQLEVEEEAKINSLLIQEVDVQAWITGIGG